MAKKRLGLLKKYQEKQMPIIALTAHVLEKEVERLMMLGITAYLFKRFKPDELISMLHKTTKKINAHVTNKF
jgi:CheY-like chemotaxis protein